MDKLKECKKELLEDITHVQGMIRVLYKWKSNLRKVEDEESDKDKKESLAGAGYFMEESSGMLREAEEYIYKSISCIEDVDGSKENKKSS